MPHDSDSNVTEEGCDLRRAQLLNAQLCQPLSLIDTLSKRHASNKPSSETTSKSISCASRIIDHALVDSMNGILRDLPILCNNRRISALRNDSNSLPLRVRLWQRSQMLSNLLDILGLQSVALGISQRLRFITNNIVPVRGARIQRLLEELRNERSRQREDEDLVVLGSLFGESLNGGRADSEMISSNEIMRRALNQLPHFRPFQMLQVVMVRSTEIRAHGTVMSGNDDTAPASLLLLVNTVFDSESSCLHRIVQDGSVLVVANAA